MARSDSTPQAVLFERLITSGHDDEPWALMVLAACDGPQSLAHYLDDGGEPVRPARRTKAAGATAREAPRAYLESISVCGFRGIGPEQKLPLHPGPGLTLVIGRNGSGKSSFAEALEVLLTGDSVRWSGKGSRFWKEGWRNLHHAATTRIRAGLVAEGLGRIELKREWNSGADIDEGETNIVRKGSAPATLAAHGWDAAAADYRPFMSHSELESLFEEGPSKLYRALLKGLGLEDYEAARKTLADAQAARKRRREEVRDGAKRILAECAAHREHTDDERIAEAVALLNEKEPDLERLAALCAGTREDETSFLSLLRDVSAVSGPDVAVLTAIAAHVRTASDAVQAIATDETSRANELAALLERALTYTAPRDGHDCPVCGTPDVITAGWRERTTKEIRRLQQVASAYREARQILGKRVGEAQALCDAPPRWLTDERLPAAVAEPLRAAWTRWNAGRQINEPAVLVAHLEREAPLLQAAASEVAEWARGELRARQDAWRPIASRVATWIESARHARRGFAQVSALKAGEEWVKTVIDDLRNERFQPIANQAIENWSLIRLQSNVQLTAIELEGAGKQQSVGLRVAVDGREAGALGVMSQGELNALALSLFLPRASLPESPFGFVIVDDPVQAMDPARVEGLARVLQRAAATRQVVVFTHDDRLPEAVRRLQIEARMVEVVRRAESVVEVRPRREPIDAYLEDARALMIAARDGGIPDGVVVRVVPGFCRAALEASCTEVVRRRHLERGDRHLDVEARLESSRTLYKLTALALFDDAERGGDVLKTMKNKWAPWAVDVFSGCQAGAHGEFVGDLDRLVQHTGKLTGLVRKLA